MANQSVWFATLVGVALKSTVVLCAAWLLAVILRGRSAAVRHLIWTAAAAAVLALPLLSISLPALPVAAPAGLAPETTVLFHATATTGAGATSTPVSPQSRQTASTPWRPNWRLSLMLVWGAGSALAFAQMLAACAGMWRIRRLSEPADDRNLSAELARGLGIGRRVEVLETGEETMPMTFGVLRPAIFLPCDASGWSEERLRMVLLHELAHVRRGDVATHLLARVALILHWWNPLAWTAWREFLKERERATDDLVLQAGALASNYASHLLDVARAMRPAGTVAVAMARRSELEGRLVAILDSNVNRKTAGRASAIVATLIGIAVVAPLAAVHAQQQVPPPVRSDVEATIRTAVAQKDPEMLEKPAESLIKIEQYDNAKKLLESAAAIREDVSGSLSVEYGVGLMKIADLERKRNHGSEAEAFYLKALQVLGDRPESAPALMEIGIRTKDSAQSFDYFQRAVRVDPSLAGTATMWMALLRERQQKPAEAEDLYRSALTMVDPDSAVAANILELFARFMNDQKREAEGKEMLDRAAVIRTALYRQGSPQASPSGVYRIGGGVTSPSVLSKVEPAYSQEARFAKFAGTVVCSVVIDPEGAPRNIQIVRGVGLGLDQQAVDAIRKWRFKPGTKDGLAVPVAANIEVNFRLL